MGRQIVGRSRRGLPEARCSLVKPRETAKHEPVKMVALQAAWREHLAPDIRLVGPFPLFPRVKDFSEDPNRPGVSRPCGSVLVDARDGFAGRGRIRLEREARERRRIGLRRWRCPWPHQQERDEQKGRSAPHWLEHTETTGAVTRKRPGGCVPPGRKARNEGDCLRTGTADRAGSAVRCRRNWSVHRHPGCR